MKNSMKRISAIFIKECKDARKCPPVIIAFFMVPFMAAILNLLLADATPAMIFSMFYPMHIVLSGLLSCSSIMAEEKEKNTLRVLVMNRVRPFEYLLGIGSFVFLGQMLGTALFILLVGGTSEIVLQLFIVAILGNLCSILLGSAIGIIVKNQISVAPFAVPIMLVLSFIPILSTGNRGLEEVGSIIFSQQISSITTALFQNQGIEKNGILIMIANIVCFMLIFVISYRKHRLDNL